MGFAGLIEPAINSLYVNRSHKLEVSTDVGQNYSLTQLDVVKKKQKTKTKAEKHLSLGCKCGLRDFSGLKTTFLFISRE